MTPRPHATLFLLITTLLLASSCTDDGDTGADMTADTRVARTGEQVYNEPAPGGNNFACATCHALDEPSDDGFFRVAFPMTNAIRRASFKNGKLTTMLDTANVCLVEWMRAEPWADDDPDWIAMRDWLEAQATVDSEPAISFAISQPPADITGGDAEAGRAFFDQSCALCHGVGGVGGELGPELADRTDMTPEYVALRIRTSGNGNSTIYDGLLAGLMPFWSIERLSDDDLRDIVAWLGTPAAP